jgi:glycerol uptake facilitator-like aquaporin
LFLTGFVGQHKGSNISNVPLLVISFQIFAVSFISIAASYSSKLHSLFIWIANVPNYNFPIILILCEVLASCFLMVVILLSVYTKALRGFSGIAIGRIVGLDIFFFASISGASMNPSRSLAPASSQGR